MCEVFFSLLVNVSFPIQYFLFHIHCYNIIIRFMLLQIEEKENKYLECNRKLTYFDIMCVIRNWYVLSMSHQRRQMEILKRSEKESQTDRVTMNLCVWKIETWSRKINVQIVSSIIEFSFGQSILLSQYVHVNDMLDKLK